MNYSDTFPLVNANLGDIVTLPDGRTRTIRARTVLEMPVTTIAGFMLLGEFEAIIATPARAGDPLLMYVPSSRSTFSVQAQPRQRAEGSLSYWAPHLPPLSNAMGEVLYRVVEVSGALDPHLVLYRSREPIYFIKSSELNPALVFLRTLAGESEDGPEGLRQAWSVHSRQQPYDETDSSADILQVEHEYATLTEPKGLYTRLMS